MRHQNSALSGIGKNTDYCIERVCMLIVCPSCKSKFSFDESKVGAEGIKLRCSKCRAIFKVGRKVSVQAAAPVPVPPPPGDTGIKVVIANESEAFCAAVKKVLDPEPFSVSTFNDGRETFEAVKRLRPDVILLDVALPSMYGFEVCEGIRKDPALAAVKIILIASIYDKTRYKRSPHSLYGADDYIEKHHIPDSLTAMIYRLVADQKPVEAGQSETVAEEEEGQAAPEHLSRTELDAQEITRQVILQDEELETTSQLFSATPQQLPEAHMKAKRLARIIVSDIILYNQNKVEDGVRNGTFYNLLQDDIREGTALYERRVPEAIRGCTSYLNEAFEELIAKKKQELGL